MAATLASPAILPRLAPPSVTCRSQSSPCLAASFSFEGSRHLTTGQSAFSINGSRGSRCCASRHVAAASAQDASPLPAALLFDCDGVLVDTERDGHRVTFNQAFKELSLGVEWDVDLYGELLKIGGGKERMTHYFDSVGWPAAAPCDPTLRPSFIAALHALKTELFTKMVEGGGLPLRPGVERLISEALSSGVRVCVCSTSSEKAVGAIVTTMLGVERARHIRVFAGDVVPRKKPDPAIYNLAASTFQLDHKRCVVIEDSHIGLTAAKAAGMTCVVTKSGYTGAEDFSAADAVFAAIGDTAADGFDLSFLAGLINGVQAAAAR